MTILFFALGLVLLVAGAEALVRGAARLAAVAGVRPLVIGLTVVAFGTSAPELAVTTSATLRGDPALALGNIVGSNILNVLLVLGLSATVAPLVVNRRLVRLEVPFLIAVSAAVLLLAWDGVIGRAEGVLLVMGGAAYTTGLVIQARSSPAIDGLGMDAATRSRPAELLLDIAFIVMGLGLLVLGSRWLVDGATDIASAMGVSDLVIGLTIVATGTSLPELATSLVATMRGERDIAVGNIVGSNLFNLLFILGITATIAPHGLVAPTAALTFDLPVMVAVSLACLPIFFTGHSIARWEGLLFLAFYLAYILYLLLSAVDHETAHGLREGLLYFAFPLTAITLAALAFREIHGRR